MNRSALHTLVGNNILTGGRRTSALGAREVYDEIIDSLLVKDDDLNVAGGYLGIDGTGIVDISFIRSATPTGLFHRDDGTWAAVGGGSSDLATVLGNGNVTGGNDIIISDGDQLTSALAKSKIDFGSDAFMQVGYESLSASSTLLQSFVVSRNQYIFGLSISTLELSSSNANLSATDGAGNQGYLDIGAASATFNHSTVLHFDAPAYSFSSIDPDTYLYLDSSGYLVSGAAPVTSGGSLTAGYIPVASAGSVLANGYLYQLSNKIGFGTLTPGTKFQVQTGASSEGISHTDGTIKLTTYLGSNVAWIGTGSNHKLAFYVNDSANPTFFLDQNYRTSFGGANQATSINASVEVNGDSITTAKAFRVLADGSEAFYIDAATGDVIYSLQTASTLSYFGVSKNLLSSTIEVDGNNLFFASGCGIDSIATGGTDVMNIGATNANVINYGNASTIHNFLGTAIYELQVNSYVTDKLITLNYGGAVASGIGVGFEIEENSMITGYLKTNAARSGFTILSPAIAYYSDLSLASLTANRTHTLPNVSGTIMLTDGTLVSGAKILVGSDATYDLWYNGGSGAITRLATANTSVLVTSGGGVPSWSAQGSAFNKAFGSTAGTVTEGNDTRLTNSRFWITVPGTPVRSSNTVFTITDTGNANLYDMLLGRTTVVKWTDSGVTKFGMIVSATYATNTVTITIVGDTLTSGATMASFVYGVNKCKPIILAIAGTIAVGTNLSGLYQAPCSMKVFGVDGYHQTAGTTNATTYDINKSTGGGGATTMFATKLSIASGATSGLGYTADSGTELAQGDVISVDCDSVSTTAPIDAYVHFFVCPLKDQYLN